MKKNILLIISVCFIFVFQTEVLCADEKESLRFIVKYNPVPARERETNRAVRPGSPREDFFYQTNELKLIGVSLLRLYQVFISPQDAPSCPFNPTCSEYARQAVARYGLVVGSIMASDRYQRCHGCGGRYYPVLEATGELYDPPERNLP